jgi:hypothetical protein
MSLADILLNTPADPTSRVIQDAMKDYFTLKEAQDVGQSLGGRLFGSGLDRQNQELDIALKRRQLQLLGPQDSQEFNDSSAPSVLGALGITWAKDLEPPKVSSGFKDSSGVLRKALMGEGLDLSKELGNVARSSGRRAGSALGRISRFANLF